VQSSRINIHTINEIQSNGVWNKGRSMHLCMSSSTFLVKSPSSCLVILFVSMWEHTKYNEHECKLVCKEKQVIFTYNKWESKEYSNR
jgi:hypothetical protein